MSLYNLLFGMNPNTEILLAIIGLKQADIERYRDCGFTDDGIYVYTRTGGGNREDYPNEKLTSNEYYLRDQDDDFDCTYATYYFKFPEQIRQDCLNFKDVRNKGISPEFIQWVIKTIERPESEEDKYLRLWNKQRDLVGQSKQTFIYETNGHTIVPLNESSLEKYLKLMEENDGGELAYSVMPYKVIVSENVPKWNFEKERPEIEREMCRVKIDFPKNWEIDNDLWERWKTKYSTKYPKSIKTISDQVAKRN